MKKLIFLTLVILASGASLFAQDFNSSYNFVAKGSQGPGTSFANTNVTAFAISWNTSPPITSCAVQVDSSSDGVTWGSGDLIASQNCAVVGSVSATALVAGKNFVRITVTTLNGTGGLNVNLKGYAGGSSSSASPVGPAMGFYFGNSCVSGTLGTNGQCFNTFANTQQANDCSWTAATPSTVTCATSHFTATDVGKQVMGWSNCQAFGNSAQFGQAAITATGAPVITTFTSGTSIQITAATNAQAAQTGCFIWGNPDDTAAAALEAVYGVVTSFCPKVFLQAANYMFTKPHFFTTPPGCAAEAFSQNQVNPGFGNTYFSGGFDLEGRGVGATQIFLTTNFPNGDACNRGGDPNFPACFLIPTMGRWDNFSITGGSNATAAGLLGHALVYGQVVTLDSVSCTNMGGFDTTSNNVGLSAGSQMQLNQYNNSGCGSVGINIVGGTPSGNVQFFKVAVENNISINIAIQTPTGSTLTDPEYSLKCIYCQLYGSQASTFASLPITILNKGGKLWLENSRVNTGFVNVTNKIIGLSNSVAGSFNVIKDSNFMFNNGAATNSSIVDSAAATTILENTSLTSQASGFDYQSVAGSILIDRGANRFTPRFSIAGSVIADGHQLKGTCTGVGTAASTLGLYGTGPNVTATTCTSATIGTGVPIQGARTAFALVVSATAAGTNASSGVVTVLKNGSATAITCTIGTATSCTDSSHSAAFANGDLISIQFTTQAADTLAGVQAFVMWQ